MESELEPQGVARRPGRNSRAAGVVLLAITATALVPSSGGAKEPAPEGRFVMKDGSEVLGVLQGRMVLRREEKLEEAGAQVFVTHLLVVEGADIATIDAAGIELRKGSKALALQVRQRDKAPWKPERYVTITEQFERMGEKLPFAKGHGDVSFTAAYLKLKASLRPEPPLRLAGSLSGAEVNEYVNLLVEGRTKGVSASEFAGP